MNRKELIKLFKIQLRTLFWETKEWLKVARKYYGNALFRNIDLRLLAASLYDDPFAQSKRYLKIRGEKNLYQYGETPLTTFEKVVKTCALRPEDKIFELGAGRGRVSFWLACVFGCDVIAIEQIPTFVKKGESLIEKFEVKNLKWICGDFLEEELSSATVLFLYGSTLSDQKIHRLLEKCEELKSGTKIITVSFSLSEYDDVGIIQPMKQFKASFPWGEASVYLQCRR